MKFLLLLKKRNMAKVVHKSAIIFEGSGGIGRVVSVISMSGAVWIWNISIGGVCGWTLKYW